MPFTPFHFGPACAIGLSMRKFLHLPTFIVANVILDVEPFLVLLFGFEYPLHGLFHTFLLAFATGLSIGFLLSLFDNKLIPIYKEFFLKPSRKQNVKSFLIAGFLGTTIHVLLDSPLYEDINPLYPITNNPFYNPTLTIYIYSACVLMGIFAVMYCVVKLTQERCIYF